MAVSERVQNDAEGTVTHGTPLGTKKSRAYLIAPCKTKFRVYESIDSYSSTTGGFSEKGKVERDPDGKPMEFASETEAEAWVKAGLPVY